MLRDNNRLAFQCLVLQPLLYPQVWPRLPQEEQSQVPPPLLPQLTHRCSSKRLRGWDRPLWLPENVGGPDSALMEDSYPSHSLFTNSVLAVAECRPHSINSDDRRLPKPLNIMVMIAALVFLVVNQCQSCINNIVFNYNGIALHWIVCLNSFLTLELKCFLRFHNQCL